MKKLLSGIAAIIAVLMIASTICFAAEPESKAAIYDVQKDYPLVTVEEGQILGFVEDDVNTFLGIPYAKAERWQMPQKADAWEGVKNCLTFREICPQNNGNTVESSAFFAGRPLVQEAENENCQFLNIWSPDINPEAKKPVMVFLHGGGFATGSASQSANHNGHGLTKHGDVVTVSINHRINALGYLDLSEFGDEYKYSGNLGSADMIAALEWIHNNISQFGGDPENVTIFGQSGGGTKVLTLMAMPAASGLFQKGIVESASIRWATQEEAKTFTAEVMDRLDVSTVDELKAVDYDTLIITADAAMSELSEQGIISYSSWCPVVDGDYYPEGYSDFEYFVEMAKDIPMMIGTTFGEMDSNALPALCNFGPIFYTGDMTEADVAERLEGSYPEMSEEIIAAFREAYPNHPVQDVLFIGKRAWSTDQYVGRYSLDNLVALAKANQGGANVYSYVFAYDYPIYGGLTATHGAELAFVFQSLNDNRALFGNDENAYRLSDVVSTAWSNFAWTGDPSQDGLEWKPFTSESGETMIFDVESECRPFHDKDLMELLIR